MNKRFFAAALTALLTLACHGNAHGHGGFGGGFHGGGFHGGGFHGGGAHFAAPRMAAPMYGGFHGGSVGGFRGAGPGFYHGPAYLGPVREFESEIHKSLSLNNLQVLSLIKVDSLLARTYVGERRILGQAPRVLVPPRAIS